MEPVKPFSQMVTKSLWAKLVSLSLLISLGGCVSNEINNFTPYAPLAEIKDQTVFNNDLKICREYAQNYINGKSVISPSQTASEGLQSALKSAGSLLTSPISPAISGLGGASGEALNELGMNGSFAKKIVANCMHDKGSKSGAYSIYDPYL